MFGILPNIILNSLHVSVSTLLFNYLLVSGSLPLSGLENSLVDVNTSLIMPVGEGIIESTIYIQ